MSVAHSGVSFNHSCLKVPVDPRSKRPSPNYERIYKYKFSDDVLGNKYRRCRETSAVSSTNSSVDNNFKSVESYLQFYETIPDYSELHHLSDEDFYSRLKSLKITQKRFCSGTNDINDEDGTDRPSSHSSIGFKNQYNLQDLYGSPKKRNEFRISSDYSNSSSGYAKKIKSQRSGKKITHNKPSCNTISDSENLSDIGLEDKGVLGDCLCENKSYVPDNSVESWKKDGLTDGSWTTDDGFCSRKTKSVPNSPAWKPKMCGYNPDVCHCTLEVQLRNRELQDYMHHHHIHCDHDRPSSLKKRDSPKKQKKSHPVPLLSRIPLYEKIMAEQEERRRANHSRYSRELRALVQPFSFTKREEEKQKRRITCSNPELNMSPKRTQPTFKAKPIPKNLFSNYAYERMREEDFYRALKKRIRAEEMLKSSSLPPSMAAREKKYRSKSLDFLDNGKGYKRACEILRRDLDFDEKTRTGKSQKRRGKPSWLSSKASISITDSSTEVSPYASVSEPVRRHQKRPLSAISTNRNNLASVLRMQTVRKKIEKEMADNLEENRQKQQAKFKERLIRMTPAWRSLNYSTEEDLALRVAARREEERLKKKRYDKLMGSIYGRVHQMPPLFQRQLTNMNQTKRTREESESTLKDYKFKYEQKKSENGETAGGKSHGVEPTRCCHFARTENSSDSSVTNEKSDGSKIDESDNESGSREDEIEDYPQELRTGDPPAKSNVT